MRLWIVLALLISGSVCLNSCAKYLLYLQQMSKLFPEKFKQQMTPYLVLSGKGIDDLGFPQTCERDSRGYSYSTVEISINTNGSQYNGYLGFCFTSNCTTSDLNGLAGFIINYIFEEYQKDVHPKFVDPPLELEFSPLSLVMCMFFLICIGIGMTAPILIWVGMCKRSDDEQFIIKSVYIDLENPNQEYDEETIHQSSTLIERLSLKYKWKQLWKSEETQKIYSFSLFRIFALPLLLYGQIFWLTNKGAYNYYAFWEEIYSQFFVKFAVFSYYIPDIFFFISAFLFTQKLLKIQGNYAYEVMASFGKRIGRLYPLYLAVLLIYWCISPSVHIGPVWYKYQEEVAVCNHSWWKVLLLIDNWFSQSCYPALWFVQAEVQYALVICLFFLIYFSSPKVSYYLLGLLYIGSIVILFLLSAEMPTQFDVALHSYTQVYFRSSYSHIFFSLTGVILGILANKQGVRLAIQQYIIDKDKLYAGLQVLGFAMSILILMRPKVWEGRWSNAFQLALCRQGILICFCIFFLRGMFKRQTHRSVLHKYGYYMYPVYLVIWMVTSSQFWSGSSFPYVSGWSLLNGTITNFFISGVLGIFLGLLFDLRTLTLKQ